MEPETLDQWLDYVKPSIDSMTSRKPRRGYKPKQHTHRQLAAIDGVKAHALTPRRITK